MRTGPTGPPRAKKSLGQNFLVDASYIDKIIAAVAPAAGDTLVEIGPGRGAITEKLVASGASVIAIELDRELIEPLRVKFTAHAGFQIFEQDALTVDFEQLVTAVPTIAQASPDADKNASEISNLESRISDFRFPISNSTHSGFTKAKLVANLPYYISTAILQHLGHQRAVFSSLVLMFQREVVDRITAKPGGSERGYLTVLTEAAFEVEKLFDLPPNAFWPVPKVWSSVVRLVPKANRPREEELQRLLSAAFAQKRKTISNNLKSAYPNYQSALDKAAIDPKARAEQLPLDDWLRLNDAILASR